MRVARATVPGFSRDFLTNHQPLGVAVSGGADSIALLHLLHQIRSDLIVLHVNYRLRGAESDGDEEFVSLKSAELGLPCLINRPELGPGNLEQAARQARYWWFAQLVKDGIVGQVATGHTQDDQAETVLFRFLRGAGTAGLAAILPQTAEGIVRPLLYSRRADVRAYLHESNLAWREDSSNNWVRFGRNKIRHNLLPELKQTWNPKITEALAQTADWARAEEEFWAAEIPRLTQNWVRFCESGVVLEIAGLNQMPLAAARRIVRWAVHRVTERRHTPEFRQVECVLSLAQKQRGLGSFRTAGWEAVRSFRLLRIAVPFQRPAYQQKLCIPGGFRLPDGSAEFTLELKAAESVYNTGGQSVDWSLISGTLELRNWRPGDRFQQAEHSASRKLKHYFQEAGIPLWERSGWPVITHDNSILWARGRGVSATYAPSVTTTMVLRISEVPLGDSGKTSNQNV